LRNDFVVDERPDAVHQNPLSWRPLPARGGQLNRSCIDSIESPENSRRPARNGRTGAEPKSGRHELLVPKARSGRRSPQGEYTRMQAGPKSRLSEMTDRPRAEPCHFRLELGNDPVLRASDPDAFGED
jgi:hypothetical protein